MRRLEYLIRIDKDPDSDWGASVPDLPGCVATGRTVDAALHAPEDGAGRMRFYAAVRVAA